MLQYNRFVPSRYEVNFNFFFLFGHESEILPCRRGTCEGSENTSEKLCGRNMGLDDADLLEADSIRMFQGRIRWDLFPALGPFSEGASSFTLRPQREPEPSRRRRLPDGLCARGLAAPRPHDVNVSSLAEG